MNRIIGCCLTMIACPLVVAAQTSAGARQRIAAAYADQAVRFEPNLGQSGKGVKFLARGQGYTVLLTSTEAELCAPEQSPVRIRLLGANPAPRVEGLEKLPEESNYFIGRDPLKWRTHVPNYGRVRYGKVYPGVDLVYYGNRRHIEHDFVVAPGADPRQIRFQVKGARRVELDRQGDLVIHTTANDLRLIKPVIYQEEAGVRREVAGQYVLRPGHNVGFDVGAYDATKPLVIDPVLSYSTYLGPGKVNYPTSLTFDSAGNAYIAGTRAGAPPTAGQNPFVTKLSPDGQVIFTTQFGSSGSVTFLALDQTDSVYMSGWISTPSDLPITENAFQKTLAPGNTHLWFGKVGPDGSTLAYCTYLGGSLRDRVFGFAVDAQGNAVATGYTQSADFPTANAIQPKLNGPRFNGFVSKLNADGSKLIYSTFLGGTGGDDRPFILALDKQGNTYVAGRTNSKDFPNVNAFQKTYGGGVYDGFVSKLSPDGSKLLFSTFLGGSGDEAAIDIALDKAGNIYTTGPTNSLDFPVRNAFQSVLSGGTCGPRVAATPGGLVPSNVCYDEFVTKLTPDGATLVYSTYFGGSGDENALEDVGTLAVDAEGYAYISGQTTSKDLPTFNALQPANAGGIDGFLAKLSQDGSALVYSTYLGGRGDDVVGLVRLDGADNVYLEGSTNSPDFPILNAARTTYDGGTLDGFIVKFVPDSGYFAVSAANHNAPLAVESLATLFGAGLAQGSDVANPQSLPTSLGGISLRVHDSSGDERFAPLLSVSPTQLSFQIPPGTALGDATLEVVNAPTAVPRITVAIRDLAPGLFALSGNRAAEYAIRVESDGRQTVLSPDDPIFVDDRPIFLALYGTGIRNRSSLDKVTCTIGGQSVPVEYAGPGGGVPGLDQVNVRLTSALKGNSDGHLILTVDGIAANVVLVDVR